MQTCGYCDTATTIEEADPESQEKQPSKVLVLKLKAKKKPKVTWTEETVDNEHLDKKSSKSKYIL
jgi:protein phosphatase 1 regulatory subunit 11